METALRHNGTTSPRALLIAQFLTVTEHLPASALQENPILGFRQRIALQSLSACSQEGLHNASSLFTFFWMSVWILTMHEYGISAIMEEPRSRSFRFDWQDYRRTRNESSRKVWIWHDGNRISLDQNGLHRGGILARLVHRADAETEVELWRIESMDTQSIKGAFLDGWSLEDEVMQEPVDRERLIERLRALHLPETPGVPFS